MSRKNSEMCQKCHLHERFEKESFVILNVYPVWQEPIRIRCLPEGVHERGYV